MSLFDISQPALDYQQHLVNTWDGDFNNYQTIFLEYQKNHPDLIYAWRSWNVWDTEVDAFLTTAKMSAEQFKTVWQQYIRLNISYTPVDLHNTADVENFVLFAVPIEYIYFQIYPSPPW